VKHRPLVVMSVALLGLGILAGCSSGESGSSVATTASRSAASATDVAFAQSMIPHHEQAVEMADMALTADSSASEDVQRLAEQIQAAQGPEIQQMTGWLESWGTPTTMPGATDADGMQGMDHSGHDMGGVMVAGMMTAEQMQQLEQASGEQFDDMWLTMMIAHHQGAIAMAQQAQASSNPEVAALADAIVTAQREEIQVMQELLTEDSP